jgi:hypothetical protein
MSVLLLRLVFLTTVGSRRLTHVVAIEVPTLVQNWRVSLRSPERISLVKPAVLH